MSVVALVSYARLRVIGAMAILFRSRRAPAVVGTNALAAVSGAGMSRVAWSVMAELLEVASTVIVSRTTTQRLSIPCSANLVRRTGDISRSPGVSGRPRGR